MRELHSLERVREILAGRKEPCWSTCKGWEVFHTDGAGLEIEVCDECCHLNCLDLNDDDVEQLPEAKVALDQAIAKAQAEIDAAQKG